MTDAIFYYITKTIIENMGIKTYNYENKRPPKQYGKYEKVDK